MINDKIGNITTGCSESPEICTAMKLKPRWVKDWMLCFLTSVTITEIMLTVHDIYTQYSVYEVNIDFETFIRQSYARDNRIPLLTSQLRHNSSTEPHLRISDGRNCQSCSLALPTGIYNDKGCQSCSLAPPTGIFNEERCQSCSFVPPPVIHSPADGWCEQGQKSLLILINSKTEHFERRQTLRNTWIKTITSNKYGLNMNYVFLLGRTSKHTIDTKVSIEYSKHRDMLVSEFHDKYNNLNIKTLTGFQFAASTCPEALFVLKADDDLFINTFSLQTWISSASFNATNKIMGNCFGSGYPHRSPTSKWYASYRSFPHQYYPAFCLGAAMLMEQSAVTKLLQAAREHPLFHVEDVYISGLLAGAAKVQVKQVQGFIHHKVHLDGICPWASETHSSLLHNDDDFYLLHKQMMNHSCLDSYV